MALGHQPSRPAAATDTIPFWARTRKLGVYNRDLAWQPHLDLYYRSAYYNEFVVPVRSFDVVGMVVPVSDANGRRGAANLLFSHEREDGPEFGDRGLALLRLLFPAFKAGVNTHVRLAEHRSTLTRTLDAAREGLLLCDASGRILHMTPALSRILEEEDEDVKLLAGLQNLARKLAGGRWAEDKATAIAGARVSKEVQTSRTLYRIFGSYVGGEPIEPPGFVVLTVEPATARLPTEGSLREQFGLTKREAEVALLLAEGKENSEIATLLCISPHTARHHTEQILSKLGIHTRKKVKSIIVNGGRQP